MFAWRRLPSLALVPVLVALALACAHATPIAELQSRAHELEGKEVTAAGKVIKTVELPLLSNRWYEIDDGSGTLWVQTNQPVPSRGTTVRVTGTMSPGLKVPGLELGSVLDERERR